MNKFFFLCSSVLVGVFASDDDVPPPPQLPLRRDGARRRGEMRISLQLPAGFSGNLVFVGEPPPGGDFGGLLGGRQRTSEDIQRPDAEGMQGVT